MALFFNTKNLIILRFDMNLSTTTSYQNTTLRDDQPERHSKAKDAVSM